MLECFYFRLKLKIPLKNIVPDNPYLKLILFENNTAMKVCYPTDQDKLTIEFWALDDLKFQTL